MGSEGDGLQPLRFTPFEHYLFEDDRAAYPMCFFMRFSLKQPLCLRCLAAAVQDMRDRHALFFATVVRKRGKPHWRCDTATPTIEAHGDRFFSQQQDWAIDLTKRSGLRLSVGVSNGRHEIWLQVHHCCADGLGMVRFFGDLLEVYRRKHPGCGHDARRTALSGQLVQEKRQLHRDLACRRVGFSSSWRPYLPPRARLVKRFLSYYGRKTRSLVPASTRDPSSAIPFQPAFVTQRFAFAGTARKRSPESATINDGFLSAVLQSLAAYLKRLDESGWLRVAVPINQRRTHGDIDSAVNRCTLVFLDRHTRDLLQANDASRLTSISTEMREVMQYNLGAGLQDVLCVLSALPMAMGLAVRDTRSAVSVVASNLGCFSDALLPNAVAGSDRAGDVLGDEFDFLPPLRPGTNVSFGLATYRGRTHLNLHFDARVIKRAEAETLLHSVGSAFNAFLTGHQ